MCSSHGTILPRPILPCPFPGVWFAAMYHLYNAIYDDVILRFLDSFIFSNITTI